MKIQTVLFWSALVGAAYLLLRKSEGGTSPAAAGATSRSVNADDSPVVHVVEETLHKHEGEDNPIVHAFEQALEHKHEAA